LTFAHLHVIIAELTIDVLYNWRRHHFIRYVSVYKEEGSDMFTTNIHL